jgi:hypothetical protein
MYLYFRITPKYIFVLYFYVSVLVLVRHQLNKTELLGLEMGYCWEQYMKSELHDVLFFGRRNACPVIDLMVTYKESFTSKQFAWYK